MSLSPEDWRRALAMLRAETNSVVALAEMAGLDKTRDFRAADLRSLDFGTDDVSGIDFTGANLEFANLAGVRGLESAILTGARLVGARLPPPPQDYRPLMAQQMIEDGWMPPSSWRMHIRKLRIVNKNFSEDRKSVV